LKHKARCTGDLVDAINSLEQAQTKAAQAAERLAVRVFWLNVVIGFVTVVGVVIACLTYLRAPRGHKDVSCILPIAFALEVQVPTGKSRFPIG
jgi:hypothetical protein